MITKMFEDKLGIKTVPEVSDPTGQYSMWDDGGCESDVGIFLYGFVRMLKPKRILSTGIYSGISDMYIAQALKDNGFGRTTALEYEQFHIDRARKLWEQMGVSPQITSINSASLTFQDANLTSFYNEINDCSEILHQRMKLKLE